MRESTLDFVAESLGLTLSAAEKGRLGAFGALAATWNRRLNLAGTSDLRSLASVLFADAMMLRDLIEADGHLVDVGAGAGAPTLPLLLLRPDLRATLIEPRRKRVAFMRTAIGSLDLTERASVEERRVEPGETASYDVALSRATFSPSEWLERGQALAETVVVLVGKNGLPVPQGLRLIEERSYRLPIADAPRTLGVFAS